VPLVLELAPSKLADNEPSAAQINWQTIDDDWVYKHQGYAVQWFSMAAVFFIACLILLFKSMRNSKLNLIEDE
jgi:cytochrome oxidase assembly protein ShyY1